jgi:hypothetical protein
MRGQGRKILLLIRPQHKYSIARNMPRAVTKVNDDGTDASPSTSNEPATDSTRQSKIQKKSNGIEMSKQEAKEKAIMFGIRK